MRIIVFFIAFFFFCHPINGQSNWQWTQLSPLPIATTGNALCEGNKAGEKHVYSFGGISDSLYPQHIHNKVFKYKVSDDEWSEVASIPDSMGKLDFQASFVNNRIYLIGGRYILADSTEIVSEKVNVFSVSLDTFEIDASSPPIPVYGHVQSVWRDSLIFVISGFDGTQNIPEVQIYNPYFNAWTAGDPIPNNDEYKAHGAAGYILGDTIFYYGGAIHTPHPQAVKILRKGVINANDPTQIDWSLINPSPQSTHFSGVASGHNNTIFWLGGSKDYHEFNLALHDTNLVATGINQVIEYTATSQFYLNNYLYQSTPYSVMDLNGIAKLGGGNWIIAGGVDSLKQISDRVFLLHNSSLTDLAKAQHPPIFKVNELNDFYIAVTENIGEIVVYDIAGRTIFKSKKHLSDLYIPKSQLTRGILLFVYEDDFNLPVVIKKINP
ncbi:MAG TPA: hypothetical protein VKX31_04550 [Brumimicrobium sp.]|nr:hypothetical protein [Brumimicrobium sp.]